ncbi:MAG: hypothetical protein M3421_11410 [Bacteroidota bacterium]|nr:hypothetical protein [Bacteroidota bacterium]
MKVIFYFFLSFLLIVVVITFDLTFWDTEERLRSIGKAVEFLLIDEPPKLSFLHLLRTFIIFLSSLIFVLGILKINSKDSTSSSYINSDGFTGLKEFYGTKYAFQKRKIILWFIVILSFYFVFIFITHPDLFSQLTLEDGPIENLSAIFYFFSFGIFIYILLNVKIIPKNHQFIFFFLSLGFAGAFFLIGMEEISWFQRVFDIKTPKLLKANDQEELNLHNLLTTPIENAYYFSAFLFFVLIPFLNERTTVFTKADYLRMFIPNRFLLFTGVIIMAYNYDMWNNFIMQWCFFVTLLILLYYLWSAYKLNEDYFLIFTILIIYMFSQFIFILKGSNFSRIWEVTEFKEFYIALAYLLFAIEVLGRVHNFKLNAKLSVKPPQQNKKVKLY